MKSDQREISVSINGRTASAIAMQVSPAEIDAMDHNRWRYGELQKLRCGQPNRYLETRYRS